MAEQDTTGFTRPTLSVDQNAQLIDADGLLDEADKVLDELEEIGVDVSVTRQQSAQARAIGRGLRERFQPGRARGRRRPTT